MYLSFFLSFSSYQKNSVAFHIVFCNCECIFVYLSFPIYITSLFSALSKLNLVLYINHWHSIFWELTYWFLYAGLDNDCIQNDT